MPIKSDPPPPPGIDKEKERIKFDYIKGSHFRVVHADGISGSISPQGDYLQLVVWNERWPIPKQTTYQLKSDQSLGDEVLDERISRAAVVREVEISLVMDFDIAEGLHEMLTSILKDHKKAAGKQSRSTKRSKKGGNHENLH
jgi:hypothetical protein